MFVQIFFKVKKFWAVVASIFVKRVGVVAAQVTLKGFGRLEVGIANIAVKFDGGVSIFEMLDDVALPGKMFLAHLAAITLFFCHRLRGTVTASRSRETEAMEHELTHLYAGYGGQSATEARSRSDTLDLFSGVPSETDMRGSMTSYINPCSAIQDGEPIKFTINAVPNHYLDLGTAKLKGVVKIVRVDKATNEEKPYVTRNVSVCNYFPAALFSALDVNIMGRSVSKMASPNLHMKMYLQTLLSYGSEAKMSHLRAAGWCMDEAETFDDFEGLGYKSRRGAFDKGIDVDFMLPLNVDIFSIHKLFPDFLDIDITFHRTRDSIPLRAVDAVEDETIKKSDEDVAALTPAAKIKYDAKIAKDKANVEEANKSTYKIRIKNLTLIVRRILIQQNLVKHHQHLLNGGKLLRYPVTRTEIKELCQINTDTKSLVVNQLYSGRLPNNLIIGLIPSKALQGDFALNPFNFGNHNVCSIYLEVNQKIVPAGGYKPQFDKGLYSKEFYGLFENTGIHFSNNGNAISPKLFKDGCCLYAFDLSPDLCLNYHTHMEEFGLITLHIQMTECPQKALTPISFASFDDVLCINSNGECFYELAGAS